MLAEVVRVKKILSIVIMLSLFILSFSTPALAKGAKSSGGFSRPSTTKTSPGSTSGPGSAQGTTTEKIPYTNLPANKANNPTGGTQIPGSGYSSFQNTSRGFMPSYTPFSGNFWLWMLLFNGFHQPAAPAAASEGAAGQPGDAGPVLYDPGLSGYWNANPLANIVSTLILLAMIVMAVVVVRKLFKRIKMNQAPMR